MDRSAIISLFAMLALCACEAEIGQEDAGGASTAAAGAARADGKAQENTFSMKAGGMDIKVAIPEGIRNNVEFDSDSDILYPAASFSGMHVQGDGDGAASGQGSVEIRFSSSDAPDKIAAWYRDPARQDFSVASVRQEGDGFVIAGSQREGDAFTIRLGPKPGGGTDGRLVLPSAS